REYVSRGLRRRDNCPRLTLSARMPFADAKGSDNECPSIPHVLRGVFEGRRGGLSERCKDDKRRGYPAVHWEAPDREYRPDVLDKEQHFCVSGRSSGQDILISLRGPPPAIHPIDN